MQRTLMTAVPTYIAANATDPMTLGTVERRPVGPHDVRIDIRWSGICHSDIHTVRGDWGPQPYPLTVGHEIAGIVAEVGSEVTTHQVGDRAGVGHFPPAPPLSRPRRRAVQSSPRTAKSRRPPSTLSSMPSSAPPATTAALWNVLSLPPSPSLGAVPTSPAPLA